MFSWSIHTRQWRQNAINISLAFSLSSRGDCKYSPTPAAKLCCPHGSSVRTKCLQNDWEKVFFCFCFFLPLKKWSFLWWRIEWLWFWDWLIVSNLQDHHLRKIVLSFPFLFCNFSHAFIQSRSEDEQKQSVMLFKQHYTLFFVNHLSSYLYWTVDSVNVWFFFFIFQRCCLTRSP